MPQSLTKPRLAAFHRQGGRCYYCGAPMWLGHPGEFPDRYGISDGLAARLQCTGEHLLARQDGGDCSPANIVAACWFCNQKRHSRKRPPSAETYQQKVRDRLRLGRWHPAEIRRLLSLPPPK